MKQIVVDQVFLIKLFTYLLVRLIVIRVYTFVISRVLADKSRKGRKRRRRGRGRGEERAKGFEGVVRTAYGEAGGGRSGRHGRERA